MKNLVIYLKPPFFVLSLLLHSQIQKILRMFLAARKIAPLGKIYENIHHQALKKAGVISKDSMNLGLGSKRNISDVL